MRLTCPCCGATNSLETLLNDAAARQAVARALSLPAGLGPGLLRYLGMFRPPQRSLTWDRVAKLLDELIVMIDAGQIQRHGRFWPAPIAAWKAALDEITDRRSLDLPLKSHGYLLEIIAGISNKAEAVAEAEEEQRRHRPREGVQAGMQGINALLQNLPAAPEGRGGGEVLTEPRPDRVPPPRTPPSAAFLALRQKLMGTDNLAPRAGETLEPPA